MSRIRASRAFGTLRGSVFCDRSFPLTTKRMVYSSTVVGILLYGAKSWAIKEPTIRKTETFHKLMCVLHNGY